MVVRGARDSILKKAIIPVKSIFKTLQRYINNKKIRTKTIFLYVFCVLVPVVVTNTFIIGNMLKVSREEADKNMNNIVESVAQDISTTLESAVYVTVDLYTSSSICNFLDNQYKTQVEFFQEYNSVFENYVFYASSKHVVSGITLYSDNKTMTNGGRYFRIDSVEKEDWYQKFVEADDDLFIYPYYCDTDYDRYKTRMLSVVRKLNYIGTNEIDKFVKLDLNYDKINEYVKSSVFNTTVYICHDNKIIFTNDTADKGLKQEYNSSKMIDLSKVQVKKSFSAYGFDYDIYLEGYKSNYAAQLKSQIWLISVLLMADALIPAVVLLLFGNSITKRVLLLGRYLKKVKSGEFDAIPEQEGKDEIGELLDNYNLMAARMKNLIDYEYISKLEQQESHLARQQAELHALHSQINPHFMFNVLESIRMRCLINNEQETSQMIESLARLMRKSAEWGADLITIEQEISFAGDYLKLQKHRFGDVFDYKFRISEECASYMIPSLSLVTFVENSCVHGFEREGHSGMIFVVVYREEEFLFIEIEDTGIGMIQEQVLELEKTLNEADIDKLQKKTNLGMLNACIRIKKHFGSQTHITIESEIKVGTCITIKIPACHLIKGLLKTDAKGGLIDAC